MLVSVIVPAYRQEKTIKEDIEHIYEVMSKTRFEFEVIVIVDGFVDGTLDEAKKANKPNIVVTGYEKNRGKGYAVRYGMARAKGDLIAFIDAGMEINPNGISMILEQAIWNDADIVVGSKMHPESKVNAPPFRKIYTWGYHTLVKLLFRIPLNDTQVGLKVFKRKVLEAVLPRLVVKKFAFDIELLGVAKYLGFTKMYEAPVQINMNLKNSGFKKSFILDPLVRNMFIDTFAVFYRMYILGYYHPKSKRKWIYDSELEMRVNTGEFTRSADSYE